MGIVDIKKIIQELVVPELHKIKTEIRLIHSEIKRVDQRIDGVERRMDSLEREIRATREEFKMAIDIHERLAAIEAKVMH